MSDFKGEDYDFAAGSIHGMRSWSMDDLGRLHGVTHAEVWRPGENVSACKATRRVPCPEIVKAEAREASKRLNNTCSCGRGHSVENAIHFYKQPPTCGASDCYDGSHPEPSSHTFDPNCECGFWAYDEHTFKSHGDVSGVIEGYGKATIGTRGFRCEKAKIVALCREHDDELLSLSSWLRLQQLYPDVAFFEDVDEMVTRFGGVLRNWEQVGEDFWDKPVRRRDSGLFVSAFAPTWGTSRALTSAMTSRWLGGSGA